MGPTKSAPLEIEVFPTRDEKACCPALRHGYLCRGTYQVHHNRSGLNIITFASQFSTEYIILLFLYRSKFSGRRPMVRNASISSYMKFRRVIRTRVLLLYMLGMVLIVRPYWYAQLYWYEREGMAYTYIYIYIYQVYIYYTWYLVTCTRYCLHLHGFSARKYYCL